jgi:flagellar hook-associated protein 1
MNSIYSIAIQSLSVYQSAMNITSQNIANVQTPFYSRREINIMEGLAQSGVNLGDVQRIYSSAASSNVQAATSNFSNSDTYLNGLQTLEPLLDNDDNSISKYINDSIATLQQLNANTGSIQDRSVYLNKLSILINQFNTINSQLVTQQQTINTQLQSVTAGANSILQSITNINSEIASAPALEDTGPLYDQREQLVQELAKYFDFTSETDSSGQLSISLNNGIELVGKDQLLSFTTVTDANYPTQLNVAVNNGATNIPVSSFINGGQIAGLFGYRQTLTATAQSVNELALGITQTINSQNKLGIDYNGDLGQNILNDINNNNLINDRVIPDNQNTGSGVLTVNVNSVSQLTGSNYQLQFTTPTQYTLTRISDNSLVSSGTLGSLPQAISVDGFTVNVSSGSIAAGDQYIISPTAGAVNNMQLAISDPKLLALAFPVNGSGTTQAGSDGAIEITSITDTTTSAFSIPKQLNPPINVVFLSPTSYQIVNANNNTVMEGPITYDPEGGANVFPTPGGFDPGYRVTITGSTLQTGDVFNITYNGNGNGDNRNGLALANLFQQGVLDNGTVNFIQAYDLLSSAVSQQTSVVETQYDSNKILREQATTEFNEISAVDTQEETVNLMSYQQAYQASAQMLQVAKTVFDDVLMMLRG